MHKYLIYSLGCFLFFATACAQNKLVTVQSKKLNPGNLNFYLQSKALDSLRPTKRPLIVVLHGCSQNAETIARQSGWDKLSEEHDFFVLYPQQKIVNNPNLCFSWFNTNDVSKNDGEACSIKNMILHLADSLPIDRERIYVYGVSAGAAMSVALMALYPEVFKAGASLAGAPFGSANDFIEAFKIMIDGINKSPEAWAKLVREEHSNPQISYPRLVVVHGTKDMIVNISNSYELIKQWSALYRTDTIADEIKNQYEGNSNVQKLSYHNQNKKTVITFYKINHLGHALAIDPGTQAKQGGETGLFATDMDFFSTWFIAKDFGLLR